MNTIFIGTRAKALTEGFLIDISDITQKAGISFPVAIDESLYQMLKAIPEDSDISFDNRIQDVVMEGLIVLLSTNHKATSPLLYKYLIDTKAGCDPTILNLSLVLDSDDNGEPIATICLVDE